eukprot:jgi/Chrzof1/8238/Cz03g02180.t1
MVINQINTSKQHCLTPCRCRLDTWELPHAPVASLSQDILLASQAQAMFVLSCLLLVLIPALSNSCWLLNGRGDCPVVQRSLHLTCNVLPQNSTLQALTGPRPEAAAAVRAAQYGRCSTGGAAAAVRAPQGER